MRSGKNFEIGYACASCVLNVIWFGRLVADVGSGSVIKIIAEINCVLRILESTVLLENIQLAFDSKRTFEDIGQFQRSIKSGLFVSVAFPVQIKSFANI